VALIYGNGEDVISHWSDNVAILSRGSLMLDLRSTAKRPQYMWTSDRCPAIDP
jgi:hypothetical protein